MERVDWETRLPTRDERGALTYITSRAPFIKCRIYYQSNSDTAILGPALVDSGAAGLLMSKRYADHWGVDLSTLEEEECYGAGGALNTYHCGGFTVVIMGVAGELQVEGAFTDCRFPQFPLLGIKTVFQKYKVTVDALGGAIDLEPY